MKNLPIILVLLLVIGIGQTLISGAVVDDPATLMAIPLAAAAWGIVSWQAKRMGRTAEASKWLVRLGVAALVIRLALGTTLLGTGTGMSFGGDFDTYHIVGSGLVTEWNGGTPLSDGARKRFLGYGSDLTKAHGSRAGFYYFVGGLYFVFGSSMYVTMVTMCLFGALSCLLVYAIARDMFSETIGRRSALLAGFFPSIVLWTSQGYKDGLIIFCLLLVYRCTQKLQKDLALAETAGLILGLWAIYQVRGYIFYVAVGPVILALTNRRAGDKTAFYNQLFGILLLGIGIIASGLGNNLLNQLQEVNLKEMNSVRSGLANDAASGFEKNADISTPGAALAYLPTGVSYFLLAPFPWQMTKTSQLVTLPEMIVWWSLFPSLVRGIRLAVRERLGEASGILIFLITLTLVYGLAQGNVGTAYRVRAQLLVFYFMFASAGLSKRHLLNWVLPSAPEPQPDSPPVPPLVPGIAQRA